MVENLLFTYISRDFFSYNLFFKFYRIWTTHEFTTFSFTYGPFLIKYTNTVYICLVLRLSVVEIKIHSWLSKYLTKPFFFTKSSVIYSPFSNYTLLRKSRDIPVPKFIVYVLRYDFTPFSDIVWRSERLNFTVSLNMSTLCFTKNISNIMLDKESRMKPNLFYQCVF